MAGPATPVLLWLRRALRLADNPALQAALDTKRPLIPIFIWSPQEEDPWAPGAAARWWLHHSLADLAAALKARGATLVLRCGPCADVLEALLQSTRADTVVWDRAWSPAGRARDDAVRQRLGAGNVRMVEVNTSLLAPPWACRTQAGGPYQVFTPFWRAFSRELAPPAEIVPPARLPGGARWPRQVALARLDLLPQHDWTAPLQAAWRPGEAGAREALSRFCAAGLGGYAAGRDRPAEPGTSRLSPHLHFGEISPWQVWRAVGAASSEAVPAASGEAFLRQLGWREFAHSLLYHFPETPARALKRPFRRFPWRRQASLLTAWQKGRTGYPLVDAGMRELWATGWMHNRVRMVAASFLVKHLLQPWQAGAQWFWDTLVDADLANNTLGWQWVAGCGADAAPYFRIFNPTAQAKRYDPHGDYIRRWVPELAALPDRHLAQPWAAPPAVLAAAGVRLDTDYPSPLVDHKTARQKALAALATLKA